MAKEYAKKEEKECSVCVDKFTTRLYPDGRRIGGHYIGTMTLPKGNGRYERIEGGDVSRWTGKKEKAEYWECNDCHNKNDREGWLEEMIEKIYGERCPDKDSHCPLCQAWELYDNIVREGKEQAKKAKKNKRANK